MTAEVFYLNGEKWIPWEHLIPVPFVSKDRLGRKLNKGIFSGRKIGQRWYMTESQIEAAISAEQPKNNKNTAANQPTSTASTRGRRAS